MNQSAGAKKLIYSFVELLSSPLKQYVEHYRVREVATPSQRCRRHDCCLRLAARSSPHPTPAGSSPCRPRDCRTPDGPSKAAACRTPDPGRRPPNRCKPAALPHAPLVPSGRRASDLPMRRGAEQLPAAAHLRRQGQRPRLT